MVGAGASGAVMASRLSEDPARQVVLLEAGPDYPPDGPLPPDLADGGRNSMARHDWGYIHRPMPRTVRRPLPRGKVVGGSSAVNTCIALRGQPWDYDEWGRLGLEDWSWEACLPAFRRLERDMDFADAWHGTDGPLPIRRHPRAEWEPWQAVFVDAALALGHPEAKDTNDPTSTGVGPHAMNKIEGRRISAAAAWLTTEVRARPNLQVIPRTRVLRLSVRGGAVEGVEVSMDGGPRRVLRARQVVLAGGAIETPRLLLASGIGAPERVRALGVRPVHALPAVGRRLLDHPGTAIFLRPKEGYWRRGAPLIQTVSRFDSGLVEGPNDLLMQPGTTVPMGARDLPLASLMMQVGKPEGAGRITYRSVEPGGAVDIDTRLFADPRDRAMALVGLDRMRELLDHPSVRAVMTPVGPPRALLGRPVWLESLLHHLCDSGYHPCGTAPMGRDAEEGATDARGRVWGVEGLWIADASLFPTIPTSNIHLAVLMVAERIARFVAASDGAFAAE